MSRYVLVHGACHGAWCWYKIIPRLERAGHEVVAIDLPGLGADRTPLSQSGFRKYVDRVCDVLSQSTVSSVLVGHSMGGAVISASAERLPDTIVSLVYVTAFLLRDGESIAELSTTSASHNPNISVLAPDGLSMTIASSELQKTFYGECSSDDVALARTLLLPQLLEPLVFRIRLSERSFGRIPRFYIECTRDMAIDTALQTSMYTASPCANVFSIDTDHSPFFSRPSELCAHLLKCACDSGSARDAGSQHSSSL